MFKPDVYNNTVFGVLSKMENSEYEFILTGSHFFGNATVNSDYDFFVEATANKEIIKSLKNLGFDRISSSGYQDTIISAVYRYEMKNGTAVDVQIIQKGQLGTKVEAQTLIARKFHPDELPTTKEGRTAMWDFAIRMVCAPD